MLSDVSSGQQVGEYNNFHNVKQEYQLPIKRNYLETSDDDSENQGT